jgi:hypothetical protein
LRYRSGRCGEVERENARKLLKPDAALEQQARLEGLPAQRLLLLLRVLLLLLVLHHRLMVHTGNCHILQVHVELVVGVPAVQDGLSRSVSTFDLVLFVLRRGRGLTIIEGSMGPEKPAVPVPPAPAPPGKTAPAVELTLSRDGWPRRCTFISRAERAESPEN